MYAIFPRHVFFQKPLGQSSSRVDLVCNQKWSFQIRLRPGSAFGKWELGMVPNLHLVSSVALQNPESFRISISIPVSGVHKSDGILNTWMSLLLRTHKLLTSLSMLPTPSTLQSHDCPTVWGHMGGWGWGWVFQSLWGHFSACDASEHQRKSYILLSRSNVIGICINGMYFCVAIYFKNPLFSLVAHLVKNLPAMQETWLQSLGWEDPWRRERLPIPVFWPGEFHGLYSSWGRKELNTTEWLAL